MGANDEAASTARLTGDQDYFTKVLEDNLKAVVKPQYVDQIPKAVKGSDRTVETLLRARCQQDNFEKICDVLGESSRGVVVMCFMLTSGQS